MDYQSFLGMGLRVRMEPRYHDHHHNDDDDDDDDDDDNSIDQDDYDNLPLNTMLFQMTVMHRRSRMRRNFESECAVFFSYFNDSYVISV